MNSTMRASCAVFLLVLVVGSCFAEASAMRNAKSRNKSRASNNRRKKKTTASARSVSRGGKSTAIAVSRSRAYEEVKNVVKEIHEAISLESHDEQQLVALAAKEVEARGLAFAAAFAGAYVEVSVEGFGEACGSAEASARAEATAFAQAIAGALAEVENDLGIADADAIAEALSLGVAKAVAKAYADACTTDGFAKAIQESLSVAIVEPIARAIASAIAAVDGTGAGTAEAFTDSESTVLETVTTEGTSTSDVQGISDAGAGGKSNANTAQIFPCEGKYTECCGRSALRTGICACQLGPGNFGCFAIPNLAASTPTATVWADRLSSHTCFCAH